MKRFVIYRMAVTLGVQRATTASTPSKNGMGVLLPVDAAERSQHATKNNGNASSSMTDGEGQGLLGLHEYSDRCIRRSTLVNLVDGAGCSSSASPNGADGQLKHLTTLLLTKMDEQRAAESGQGDATTLGEWMVVARVIDRVCFILFSVGLIVGTLAVWLKASLGSY